ncbi:Hypothetical protein R9X50_00559300 [Acrodontium crateriforme]|uniref:Uncharacterized protein n=1 Tax=Acrodontium crateriforme TaxID=150365 RepID=A0AAQ3M7G3_9PEZI|nr:Hypothetical protein R9X50_00559300 [Acrodontium crateriforme]
MSTPNLAHSDGQDDWEIVETPQSAERGHTAGCHVSYKIVRNGRRACPSHAILSGPDLKKPEVIVGDKRQVFQQEQSPLFCLPTELRLRIYELVLRIETPTVTLTRWQKYHSQRGLHSVLTLLETCRRIHAETELIFYDINTIVIPSMNPYDTCYMNTVSPKRLHAIKSLIVQVSSSSDALAKLQDVALRFRVHKLIVERHQSVRFIDVRSWAYFRQQMQAEVENMSELKDIDFITPSAKGNISEDELRRLQKLNAIDDTLRLVVDLK